MYYVYVIMYGSILCVEHFRNKEIAPTTHTCAAIVLVQPEITVELSVLRLV